MSQYVHVRFTLPQARALFNAANEGAADMEARSADMADDKPALLNRAINILAGAIVEVEDRGKDKP